MAAAYAATFRRAVLLGTRLRGPNRFGSRSISDVAKFNGKPLLRVDTLAFVRRMETQGVPTKQAEALTAAWSEILNESLEKIFQNLVSRAELEKNVMTYESILSKFRTEVTSSEKHNFSLLQHDVEKLRGDIEKMRSELRYELDKVTAGQRLDLNLEKGRIRDEMHNQNNVTNNLDARLHREINDTLGLFEAAKYDVVKYCIGALASISAVGLAALRILL